MYLALLNLHLLLCCIMSKYKYTKLYNVPYTMDSASIQIEEPFAALPNRKAYPIHWDNFQIP